MRALAARLAVVAFLVASGAQAADFYVDPQNGSAAGDGSATKPWKTIQEVIDGNKVESQAWASLPYQAGAKLVAKNAGAPVKAGDTIWLRSGYHGTLDITGYYNTGLVTIAADKGATPKLSKVLVRASSNWKLSGLDVSPEYAPSYDPATMVTIDDHDWQGPIHDVTVENCKLTSKADVSAWSMSDWDQLSANGFQVEGDKITIRNNLLKNVNFGISVSATNSLIEYNTVDSFAGDGMRGLGDYTTFQYNTVKNCYAVNANHDDGFQSWSVGSDGNVGTGEVKGIVLRGNRIINYEDPNQPFRGTLQGIGCFDGMFVDWVVENNVVITDHWHGITLLGAKGCHVINNTVIDPNTDKPGPPWISIDAHKDGTPPSDCVVRNNLVTDLALASTGVTEDHNIIVKDYGALFVDAAKYDLHLLPTAAALDVGSADLAPKIDIEGIPRPQGAGVDVGAYEWHDPSVTPVDGGLGGGAGNAGSGGGSGAGGSGAGGGSPGGGSGVGGAGTGAAGAGANKANDSGDDSGCGCRVSGRDDHSVALLALLGLGWLGRRRRRSLSAADRSDR